MKSVSDLAWDHQWIETCNKRWQAQQDAGAGGDGCQGVEDMSNGKFAGTPVEPESFIRELKAMRGTYEQARKNCEPQYDHYYYGKVITINAVIAAAERAADRKRKRDAAAQPAKTFEDGWRFGVEQMAEAHKCDAAANKAAQDRVILTARTEGYAAGRKVGYDFGVSEGETKHRDEFGRGWLAAKEYLTTGSTIGNVTTAFSKGH